MSPTYIDYENRRAILVGDGHYEITLTTVQDLAGVVAEALDYPGEWPVVGGIHGAQVKTIDLIHLGEEIRGQFEVETVSPEDLRAGKLKTSWHPVQNHPSIPRNQVEEFSKKITLSFLRGILGGDWTASQEWNELLPNYRFTTPQEYLIGVWEGKF